MLKLPNRDKAFLKCMDTIRSCITFEQLRGANNLMDNFAKMFSNDVSRINSLARYSIQKRIQLDNQVKLPIN